MEEYIFKHTRNKEHIGVKISASIVLMILGLCSMLISILYNHYIKWNIFICFFLIGLLFTLSSVYGLWLSLISKGIIYKNDKLQTVILFFGKLYKEQTINTSNVFSVDILKFDYRTRSNDNDVGPDLKSTDYQVFLFNENHSIRTLICETLDKDEAIKVTHFLINKLEIQHIKYNPPKSARRRKR